MADNPNPQRITDASWRFMRALLAMEPDTENSGIYDDKPGFHGTRDENQARDEVDGDTNYSVEDPLDLQGPGDKAAAYDWTHRAAQRGDYRTMARYGSRLRAAFDARDPRLDGWVEAQGQTDLDATPEELNFGPNWTKSTPSSSHAWHWHLSEHRAYVESWINKECMLSILRGETLVAYLARGGQLITSAGDDMTPEQASQLRTLYELLVNGVRTQGSFTYTPVGGKSQPINLLYNAIWQVGERVGAEIVMPDVDEDAIVRGLLATLTPQVLAEALSDEVAQDVVGLLSARLAS